VQLEQRTAEGRESFRQWCDAMPAEQRSAYLSRLLDGEDRSRYASVRVPALRLDAVASGYLRPSGLLGGGLVPPATTAAPSADTGRPVGHRVR
jgi:hypothetical protein